MALTACGGSSGDGSTLSLSLDSSSVAVAQGDSDTVAITISDGGSDTITLSSSGVPSGVTESFSPATVSGSGSSTLTLDVADDAPTGDATVTVTAVGGGNSDSATFTLTVERATVEGQVVNIAGIGVGSVNVAIDGTTTTTDAEGNFTVTGVSTPYDVTLNATASGDQYVHAFRGLETFEPELLPASGIAGSVTTFSSNVTVTVPTTPPADHEALVCAEGLDQEVFGCTTISAGNTSSTLNVSWFESSTTSVRLHVLEFEQPSGDPPAAYDQYGTLSTTVSDGGTPTENLSYNGTVPSSTTLNFSLNPPTGFSVSDLTVSSEVSNTFTMPLWNTLISSESQTVTVPNFNGSFDALAIAGAGGGSNATTVGWEPDLTAGSSTTVTFMTPPSILAPSDGATGVDESTTFELNNVGSGAVTHLWQPAGTATSPVFAVTTMGPTATLPDGSPFGATLPPSTDFTWAAIATEAQNTMEAAGTGWIGRYYEALLGSTSGGAGAAASGGISTTDSNTVTTAP